nr:hypothetical protein Q903MT_gene5080 [Picea sitchensis]
MAPHKWHPRPQVPPFGSVPCATSGERLVSPKKLMLPSPVVPLPIARPARRPQPNKNDYLPNKDQPTNHDPARRP